MSVPVRLVAFAIALAALGGAGAAVGALIGPSQGEQASAHADDGHAGDDATPAGAPAAVPPGLQRVEGGYALVPERTALAAGRPERLAFRIEGPDGRPVRAFEVEHERRMHLILVRRDLTGFQHLHPEMDRDGTFHADVRLPAGGAWRMFADFRADGRSLTLGHDLMAAGTFAPAQLPPPSSTARAGAYTVRLAEGGGELAFQVHRDGRRVEDIQPYLGARGHLVALREGDLAFLHVHPLDEARPGALIRFRAELPSAGRYRLFLQFRHGGGVHTAAFTREASR